MRHGRSAHEYIKTESILTHDNSMKKVRVSTRVSESNFEYFVQHEETGLIITTNNSLSVFDHIGQVSARIFKILSKFLVFLVQSLK